jgi:hypothetical protein
MESEQTLWRLNPQQKKAPPASQRRTKFMPAAADASKNSKPNRTKQEKEEILSPDLLKSGSLGHC